MTDFRMPTTALDVVSISKGGIREIGHPLIPAAQLIAHLGASPTLTVPMLAGRQPDPEALWAYLAEPADFFDVPMPNVGELSEALERFGERLALRPGAMTAVTVTVVELDGSAQFVVTGAAVAPGRSEQVRIDACDAAFPLPRASDPHWRRMAARTTSKGEEDQLRRWLNDRGYADGVSSGEGDCVPYLGALIFVCGGDVCGLDNDEPTSILTQLMECGAVTTIRRVDSYPVDAESAWWISPHYQRHPVAAIGTATYRVSPSGTTTFVKVS